MHFDITIEICGSWIWLSGDTRKYRKQFKETGFFYTYKKKMWYWRPSDYKSANRWQSGIKIHILIHPLSCIIFIDIFKINYDLRII